MQIEDVELMDNQIQYIRAESRRLTAWEREFVGNMAKFSSEGIGLNGGQARKINEIYNRLINGTGAVLPT